MWCTSFKRLGNISYSVKFHTIFVIFVRTYVGRASEEKMFFFVGRENNKVVTGTNFCFPVSGDFLSISMEGMKSHSGHLFFFQLMTFRPLSTGKCFFMREA